MVTIYKKPIATLREGLPSVDLDTLEPHAAQYERSDVTALPACGVIAEAMLALVIADALLEKAGRRLDGGAARAPRRHPPPAGRLAARRPLASLVVSSRRRRGSGRRLWRRRARGRP